ncbi:MAG: LysM domain-containing protein, partial [Xanthobacteraceae bacterium]
MFASRRSASWPQLVAISLIGIGVASCSADSGRFNEGFGSSDPPAAHGDVTGSIQSNHIESRPLPQVASADQGTSGGGRSMGSYANSYRAPNGEVTGSIAQPPPPAWTWEGGTPVTVEPGETIEIIAHRHGVPASAVMQANNITSPAMVHPGMHLVIPRYHTTPGANSNLAAEPRYTSSVASVATPVGPPRTALAAPSSVHVVAPGETFNSIARMYNKPVIVLAKVNNIPPTTLVRVGDRIVIPDMRGPQRPTNVASAAPTSPPPRTQPAITQSSGPNLASRDAPL